VVRAATTPAKTGTTGVQYSFPALEAVDDSGVISNKSVKVLGPWGDEVTTTTGAAGTFAPTLPGRYTLVYSATDGAGNKGEARYAVNVILGAIYGNSDKVPAADLLDVDFWNADRTGIADGAKLTDHSPYNREFTRVTGAPITMNTELGKPVATFNNSTDQAYRTAWTEADYALENDGYSFETTFSMPASAPWTGDQSIFSNQQSAGVGFDAYKIGSANCFLTEQQKAGHDFCVTLWTSPMAAKRVSVALDYDTWYQVVATNDLAMERLYVNGEPVAETAGARAPASPTGGANNWVIGGDAAPGNATQFPFTGMISSARIWSNPLTPSAIAALYAGDEDPAGPGTGGAGGPGTPGGALAFTGSSLGGPLGLALGLLLVGAFAFITVRRRSAR